MVYALSLLAACAFALGSVLQQKGTLEAPAAADDPRFLAQIIRRPVWLMGALSQLTGWLLQAVALDKGSLIVVQSLCTLSLVIALPLGQHFTDQHIDNRVRAGAVAMVIGIVLFLSVSSSRTAGTTPTADAWWAAGLATLACVGVLGEFARHQQNARRALLFGAAGGFAFGLQAAVTKEFTKLVGQGLSAMLSSWTTYVLVISALVGFVCLQSALKTGVLAPAMASSNAVTLFSSVVLGVAVFAESFASGGERTGAAILGLAVAIVGIVLLSAAKPPVDAAAQPGVG